MISIQILKAGGFISIKNRYNHAVENPDNTFNSHPDNIIPGMAAAIKQHLRVDFSSQEVKLPDKYVLIGQRIINFNDEINNIYFGEDFYAKDGMVHELDKNTEIMLDCFVLNLRNKTISSPAGRDDGFIAALQEEISKGHKNILLLRENIANQMITNYRDETVSKLLGQVTAPSLIVDDDKHTNNTIASQLAQNMRQTKSHIITEDVSPKEIDKMFREAHAKKKKK